MNDTPIDALLIELHNIAADYDHIQYGLPLLSGEHLAKMRAAAQVLADEAERRGREQADILADTIEAYLQSMNDGVLHAEMGLRRAVNEYRKASK